jgi:hypothetical protein
MLRLVDLAERKGYSARAGFNLNAAATEALSMAAEAREIDRIYYDRGPTDPGAVTLYRRYAGRPGLTVDQISRGYLRAAAILMKARDAGGQARLVVVGARLGKQAAAAPYRVRLQHHLARVQEDSGDVRAASRAYARVIEAYDASGRKPGSEEAALAAEAQFWMAEDAYNKQLVPHAFRWPDDRTRRSPGPDRALAGSASRRRRNAGRCSAETTGRSRARAWATSTCGWPTADRRAHARETNTGDIGATTLEAFVEQLRKAIQPVYDEATKSWKEALAEAERRSDRGRWARHAREQLNRFEPDKYPVLREEIIVREEEP